MISYFKKNPYLLILVTILLIGLFFRTYRVVERFNFDHDSDLYSWIVKDIIVNHHPRLIGQLTTAPGIFIGPLYYYSLVPFFLLFKMDPIGTIIPITILGIATVASYYFVFSKLFNKQVGLIGSFIYAVSINTVELDRRVVPSTPVAMWVIWYLYAVIMLARGNFKVLPLLGLLVGLIWHVHIALAPTLIALPIALFFAKKIPSKKQIITFLLITIITSIPFAIFESRHQFIQTKSFIKNFTINFGAGSQISEKREVFLGKINENGKLNLNESSKFILEVEPRSPKGGETVNLNITTKNPKYSTLIVDTDCGNPTKFEIGNINGEFKWSTKGCNEGIHQITANARIPTDPFWKITLGKLVNVFDKENRNVSNSFLFPIQIPKNIQYLITILILLLPFVNYKTKSLGKKELIIFYSWIISVFLFFTFSQISVSEYYLASLDVILILTSTLVLYKVYQYKNIGKYFILILLSAFVLKNLFYYINYQNYNKGYIEKKNLIQFVTNHIKQNNFPCIGITYITTPGENSGFRYFLYLNKIHVVHPSSDVPTYNIVIPEDLSQDKEKIKFGHVGLILPKNMPTKEKIKESCKTTNTNLTDSMFGYVE
jgi:4-amino-4-deoxy-L-arabinose transferase-like glycosyltransferase